MRPGARIRLGGYGQDDCGFAPGSVPGASHPEARVLLTTFSDALANALQTKLKRLLGNEPRLASELTCIPSIPWAPGCIGRTLGLSTIVSERRALQDRGG